MPRQPIGRRVSAAQRLGFAVLAAGLLTLGGAAIYRLVERGDRPAENGEEEHGYVAAARQLNGAAATLALSVLADSGIEHYRGGFHNPAMYFAPVTASVSLINGIHMAVTPAHRGPARKVLTTIVFATGLAGFSFHISNVVKREGGICWENLFYAAPLGAPLAIMLSGLAGLAGSQLAHENRAAEAPTLLGRPAGRIVGIASAGAMLGTVAEAALLHFRGAFHDPFMFVPVTVPPTAAALTVAALLQPGLRRWARWVLYATAAAGAIGSGFHVYGVSRNMGGFYNWRQNLLNGPPIPAPPSFTGVALAGLAAVRLMEAA
jgi:hypothetical protein